MTDKFHCPFCGAELVQANTTVKKIWHCPNIDCKGHNYFGVDDFWNTIISGKKAQDALKVARNLYQELALAHCEMADDYRTTYGCLKTPEQETQEYMQEYDEKITSITKKEE